MLLYCDRSVALLSNCSGLFATGRRQLLSLSGLSALAALVPTGLIGSPALAATELIPADIKPELAPKQAEYDPTDEKLRDAASLLQQALNSNDVQVCQPA